MTGEPDTKAFEVPHGYSMLAFGRDGNLYRRGIGLTIWTKIPNYSEWPRRFVSR